MKASTFGAASGGPNKFEPSRVATKVIEDNIRIVWDDELEQYFFAVNDIVEVLTESKDPRDYIKKMLKRDPELKASWGTICPPTRMRAADGKFYKTQAATHRMRRSGKS